MFKELLKFHNEVGKKTSFWLPILLFAIGAYSFSILNPTISIDDLLRDRYVGEGNLMLAGRWGMVLWVKIFGITEYSPFIDRYLALVFLLLAAYLACVAFYTIKPAGKLLPYTILASIIVTYPLINEIWEYTGANFFSTGNMALGTLAIITLLHGAKLPKPHKKREQAKYMLAAALLLLLPCSSYESGIFYYISFVAFVIFHELITGGHPYSILDFAGKIARYVIPLAMALVLRAVITIPILIIYHLDFHQQGESEIAWITDTPLVNSLMSFKSEMMLFGLSGLIYFPVTVMLVAAAIIMLIGTLISWKRRTWQPCALAATAIASAFLLPIIMGHGVIARTALPFHILTAYSGYLICYCLLGKQKLYYAATALLLMLCIHQSTYLNSILSINHLRSENELSILRQMGLKLTSTYPDKPVVFVSPCDTRNILTERFYLNKTSWNHRLYAHIRTNHTSRPNVQRFKAISTNLNPVTAINAEYHNLFSYVGCSEINFVSHYDHEKKQLVEDAIKIAEEQKFPPYSIHDMGDYVIAVLSTPVRAHLLF